MGYIVGDIKREQNVRGLIVMTAPHCCCIVTIVTAWWVNHHGKWWFWYGNLSFVHIFGLIILADIMLNATTARLGFFFFCIFFLQKFSWCLVLLAVLAVKIYIVIIILYMYYIFIYFNAVFKIYLHGYIFCQVFVTNVLRFFTWFKG